MAVSAREVICQTKVEAVKYADDRQEWALFTTLVAKRMAAPASSRRIHISPRTGLLQRSPKDTYAQIIS